ncbi:MAG: MerR family transcriptional regulator [Reyranellaceae bacterium]
MAKSYPPDLIEKVTAFVAAGNSRREAARHFGVSASFVVKLMQRAPVHAASSEPAAPEAVVPPPPDVGNMVVSGSELAELLGVSRRSVSEFSERGIIERVSRNRFGLQRSIRLYCDHLRTVAAGRGGDGTQELTAERARLAREQADATALKNAAARRELVSTVEVEREWSLICRKVRNAILAVPSRARQTLPHLTGFDVEQLDREIRDALTGLGRDDDNLAGAAKDGLAEPASAAEAQTVGVD